jgi:hypothetical protein
MAQTTGLPQYGVLLEGTADAPVLKNNSAKRILAYSLVYDSGGTSTVDMLGQLHIQPISSVGIAPGASYLAGLHSGSIPGIGGGDRFPVPPQTRDARGLPTPTQHTSATLDAVLFDDGHVVGPDKSGLFDRLTKQIKAEQDVAGILLNSTDLQAAWQQIQTIASSPPELPALPARGGWFVGALPPGRPQFARQVLFVRQRQGDAAAIKIAESTKNYPVIVKGE